jgi:hypothetical protein
MSKVSRKRSMELLANAETVRVVRFEKRGARQFDYEDVAISPRISGWRKIERVTGSYIVFEGGSHLHPDTTQGITLERGLLVFDFGLTRITYETALEGLGQR